MKKLSVVFVVILILSFNLCLASENVDVLLNKELKILYNGQVQEFQNVNNAKVYPISYQGTTYLPIRSISCLFNTEIKWDGMTQSIYLGEGNKDTISAKNTKQFMKNNSESAIALLNQDIKIYYNTKLQSFTDAAGKIVYPLSYNGTTYLPIRAVSNLFNLNIDYDAENYAVLIRTYTLTDKQTKQLEEIYDNFPTESFANLAVKETNEYYVGQVAAIERLSVEGNEDFSKYTSKSMPVYIRLKNVYGGNLANNIMETYNKGKNILTPCNMIDNSNNLYCAIFDVDLKDYSNDWLGITSSSFFGIPYIVVTGNDATGDIHGKIEDDYERIASIDDGSKFFFSQGDLTRMYVFFEMEKEIEPTRFEFSFSLGSLQKLIAQGCIR